MNQWLVSCKCCPHQCGVNRLAGKKGFCQSDDKIRVGAICIHHGEEPVFGSDGIVNIFFSHCNLQCIYCQNSQISHSSKPQIEYQLTVEQVVKEIGSRLSSARRCVGFVSPSHVMPQMNTIIKVLKEKYSDLTIVMNSNGYDDVKMLKKMKGNIDVYLPDLKYLNYQLAADYSRVFNYPDIVKKSLKEMFDQKGHQLIIDHNRQIKSGLIIRHLVLPDQLENTRNCLEFIARTLSSEVYLSVMAQYTPTREVSEHPVLGRTITEEEYNQVIELMDEFGFHNGWIQSFESIGHYIPDFRKDHPFGSFE